MSTDDFETRLRARLVDLADREDDWDDPTPAAREIAAAGIAPDDDPAILTPTPPAPPARDRRRWLPGLAVAAVLLAVVVGAGLGIREVVRGSSNSSASGGSAGFEVAADSAGTAAPNPTPSAGSTGAAAGPGAGAGGGAVAACDVVGPAVSSGPLAATASIRPSGITGARAAAGGSAGIAYQLTFAEAGGTAELRPAYAVPVSVGQLCRSTGIARSGVVHDVPVEPGAGVNGSAVFAAVDATGRALRAGEYLVVVVVPYSVGGSGMSQLVSAPVTVTVTS